MGFRRYPSPPSLGNEQRVALRRVIVLNRLIYVVFGGSDTPYPTEPMQGRHPPVTDRSPDLGILQIYTDL
eukprot:COSAG02_NODE_42936_length_379_cov_1.614286_1_plen_69_part_10